MYVFLSYSGAGERIETETLGQILEDGNLRFRHKMFSFSSPADPHPFVRLV